MLDAPDISILVEVLALTDALWLPPRVHGPPATCLPPAAWTATAERRSRFFDAGVPYVARGTVSQRKDAERRLGALEAWGLLTVHSVTGRRTGVRLTRHGDDIARWLTASPMLCESWFWLHELAALLAAGACRGLLVREDDLARVDYGSPDTSPALLTLEYDLLALKAAGLLDDTADQQGRVWYSLTGRGRAALAGSPPLPTDLPPYDGRWCDHHTERVEALAAERLTWRPAVPSGVVVPQSCGVAPARSWHDVLHLLPPRETPHA